MFDFKAARDRIEELKLIYRQMKHRYEDDGTWSWWVMGQIEEIERDIAAAHTKMTALQSGHLITQFRNTLTPIVPQWQSGIKEEVIHVGGVR